MHFMNFITTRLDIYSRPNKTFCNAVASSLRKMLVETAVEFVKLKFVFINKNKIKVKLKFVNSRSFRNEFNVFTLKD